MCLSKIYLNTLLAMCVDRRTTGLFSSHHPSSIGYMHVHNYERKQPMQIVGSTVEANRMDIHNHPFTDRRCHQWYTDNHRVKICRCNTRDSKHTALASGAEEGVMATGIESDLEASATPRSTSPPGIGFTMF
ncbi:hypothetical protein BD410DRAFT_389314 [Rickenella mellea]|uniref:Uncharacterized protein n=1 Tax=Rickenella mellea TaxID=50990 RepID=A0A4Y7PYD9_9AGAM|nr:hypothetical protein BD410DRAFT_389314 [Rickenella mellea]